MGDALPAPQPDTMKFRTATWPVLGLALLLGACRRECPQQYVSAFPMDRYGSMMPGCAGDTIWYTNGTQSIPLLVRYRRAGAGLVEQAYRDGSACRFSQTGLRGADWGADNEGFPDSLRVRLSLSLWADSVHADNPRTSVSIQTDDDYREIALQPALGRPGTDSIATNVQLGGTVHPRVVVLTADTLNPLNRRGPVWRVYLADPGGIVAFEERRTHTRYWKR